MISTCISRACTCVYSPLVKAGGIGSGFRRHWLMCIVDYIRTCLQQESNSSTFKVNALRLVCCCALSSSK